jgi:hypothetical protein
MMLRIFGVVLTALLVVAMVDSCHGSPAYERLLPDPARVSPEIQTACQLAAKMCSQCHPIDRVIAIDHRFDAGQWEFLVRRMRLMPSSGITSTDSGVILQCLVNRLPRSDAK